ncbi:copper amine oxidase N-terminal domain-containing protein [Paenibacillus pedocola]|uniref:copper amine oxidase N-terminal domain-containing protein n=1 Tax=Paenibacillus pedocola TaxID=3242193 RepID=UPI0028774101|nr:copper amine oxidase N-terminal domain-containing protein [Paenibacillus typhae]
MKMKSRFVMLGLAALLAVGSSAGIDSKPAQAASKTYPALLKINDYYVLYTSPKAPYVDKQSRIMIPLRSISELIGAKVSYDTKSKTATIVLNGKTIQFTIGSKTVTVDGSPVQMDTVPVLDKNSIFIPVSVLSKYLGIKSSTDPQTKIYSMTGDNLMQTDMIKYTLEDTETGAKIVPPGKIVSNKAFAPVSYTYDDKKDSFTVKAKNITGADVPKGEADVAAYMLTDAGVQFLNPKRERPAVKKDGIVTESIQNGAIGEEVNYLLVKGRLLDR